MIGNLPDAAAVALSVAVWLVTCFGVGRWAVSWPSERVSRTGPVTTLRAWERSGRTWQRRLRVLAWKDRLPEAGAFFAGGTAKREIGTPTTEALQRYRGETIRAERVHWIIAATGPLHLLWCRPTVGLGMVVFGIAFDAPFIVVQRFNRGRLDRVLARRHARGE